jgi:hypothetical protein
VADEAPGLQELDMRFVRRADVTLEISETGLAEGLSAGWFGGDSVEKKATSYMALAAKQGPDEAYQALQRVLELGLEDAGTEKARRLLGEAYRQLADLTDGSGRQTYLLNKAMASMDDSPMRSEVAARIVSLGGTPDVVGIQQVARTSTATAADFGMDDSCSGATPVGVPSTTNMSIADPMNGFEDKNFLEVVISGPLGLALEIETTSPFCNDPASCSSEAFDTDLNLWGMCDNGFPELLVARDINRGDGGLGWLSKIETACLLPGAYYLEVTGQYGAAPKNFNVEIRETGSCVVPTADDFEPDNTTAEASKIGKPNSVPDHANAWGRANSEIQDHSIFPLNDEDNMRIDLTRTEQVRMATQVAFDNHFARTGLCLGNPSVSCTNYFDCNPVGGPYIWDCHYGEYPSGPDQDSQLFLLYGSDPHGGICNSVPLNLGKYCKSSSDCNPVGTPAIPSLPADFCIPMWALVFSGETESRYGVENPLAYNDDVSGGNLGSELNMCLPRTASSGPSWSIDDGLVMRSRGWRPPFEGSVSDLAYDYQSLARNQGPCIYEQEINQYPWLATPLPTNVYVNGIWEGSESLLYGVWDSDFWGPFDVGGDGEEVTVQVFPKIINPNADSEAAIWAGPDDAGNYYIVADEYLDTANTPISFLNTFLPPANEWLGNTVADGHYYVEVFSTDPAPNWYYQLRIITPLIETSEVEPNDRYPNEVGFRGKTIIDAAISVSCDIDRFQFTVAENTFLDMWTSDPSTDTVMNFQRLGGLESGQLWVIDPAAIKQSYAYGTAAFGPLATTANYQGELVLADDGTGNTFGCNPILNDLTGKVAFMDRGVCGFAVKTENAQAAGASAVLIGNDREAASGFQMGGACVGECTIASLLVSKSDATLMKSYLPATTVTYRDEELGCDDDGNTEGSNPYLSRITGCVSPGEYVVSVRGWSTSGGPYILNITGQAGCTPTEPPTMNDTGTGSSSFCPPNYPFERNCE